MDLDRNQKLRIERFEKDNAPLVITLDQENSIVSFGYLIPDSVGGPSPFIALRWPKSDSYQVILNCIDLDQATSIGSAITGQSKQDIQGLFKDALDRFMEQQKVN